MFPNQFAKPSLFSKSLGLAKGINWSGILDGTQKTLGVINQAIPIIYQVKPVISNAKTMFRIADEIRKPSSNTTPIANNSTINTSSNPDTNKPIFYI